MGNMTNGVKNALLVLIGAALIVTALAIYAVTKTRQAPPLPAETPASLPEPLRSPAITIIPFSPQPLLQGKETYNIFSAEKPTFTEAVIDPLDPGFGKRQTVAVKIRDESQITSVSAVLKTDRETATYPMERIKGTAQDGIWRGSWVVRDTYNFRYILTLEAESKTSRSHIDLTFR